MLLISTHLQGLFLLSGMAFLLFQPSCFWRCSFFKRLIPQEALCSIFQTQYPLLLQHFCNILLLQRNCWFACLFSLYCTVMYIMCTYCTLCVHIIYILYTLWNLARIRVCKFWLETLMLQTYWCRKDFGMEVRHPWFAVLTLPLAELVKFLNPSVFQFPYL